MTNFIEEFYYSNIDPQARSFEQNKKVQHDMQTLNESEDFLTDKLSGEEKKRFLQYVDAWAAVNGESTLDSFITGFRLGAQFTFDIESTLHRLPERRNITNNPAPPITAGPDCSVLSAKFEKKLVRESQVFADSGNLRFEVIR